MTFSVFMTIEGKPEPKGRPRFRRVKNFVQTYTPAKTKNYEDKVRDVAKQAMGSLEPLETPIGIQMSIKLPVPKSYSKKRTSDCLNKFEMPTKKPDWDNVAKAITDAFNGVVYVDDSQIVAASIHKMYALEPCVEVYVYEYLR